MDLLAWIANRPQVAREKGVRRSLSLSAQDIMRQFGRFAVPYDPRVTPIYEREWDVLIILDACRVDALSTVASEYSYLPTDIPSILSTASASKDWMRSNFSNAYTSEVRRTTYVTGNPFSEKEVDPTAFAELDEAWKYGWDEDEGTVPARHVTDRAIAAGRSGSDRLLVHYMQPHFPSVPDPIGSKIDLENFGRGWNSVWEQLETGDLSIERVWKSYLANLRYVLDDLELLLTNLDATNVIISADHGNAFGEWNVYGHPPGSPVGTVRRVPWVETTATDTESYEPILEQSGQREDITGEAIETRLQNLGYV